MSCFCSAHGELFYRRPSPIFKCSEVLVGRRTGVWGLCVAHSPKMFFILRKLLKLHTGRPRSRRCLIALGRLFSARHLLPSRRPSIPIVGRVLKFGLQSYTSQELFFVEYRIPAALKSRPSIRIPSNSFFRSETFFVGNDLWWLRGIDRGLVDPAGWAQYGPVSWAPHNSSCTSTMNNCNIDISI